ncbi:FAD-dependent oxidoreductase [Bacteroides thetaiotaomicron]|nr:FAD-dependent oxidoreductase [Bacteroides thetaiotaomicron]
MSTAVSAARLGCKVALINDRPVVGGNNSSEIRVHLGGAIEIGKYPELGGCKKSSVPSRRVMHNRQAIMKIIKKWNGYKLKLMFPCFLIIGRFR